MSTYKEENRKRLVELLGHIELNKNPDGWRHLTSIAVGGLLTIGFSKNGPYILVVSSAGRGLIDCDTGEKIARDEEPYKGLDDYHLFCRGIGPIENELVQLCGFNGGGLPQSNTAGETIELVAPNWPEYDLILCQNNKNALVPGDQGECNIIYTEHVRAFGFSWCGNYIAGACSSDLDIWKRIEKL